MNYNKILEICSKKGFPVKTLAKKAEISVSGLYQMIREESMKITYLEKIAEVLNLPITEFFDIDIDNPYKEEFDKLKNDYTVINEKLYKCDNSLTQKQHELSRLEELNKAKQRLIDMLIEQTKSYERSIKQLEGIIEMLNKRIESFENLKIYQDFFDKTKDAKSDPTP